MQPIPRLIPLAVPWKISPSTPYLDLTTKTLNGDIHGYVTFVGFLGESTTLKKQYGTHQQVVVVLQCVVYARLYPDFSDLDKTRLNAYDWSLLVEQEAKDDNFQGHFRSFHDQWNATNQCPNPSACIIENSDVLQLLGVIDNQFNHYLFIGDDYNIEVVAKSIKWEIVASCAEPVGDQVGTGE